MLQDRISDLRRQAGWSQEELAERLDVSRQSVSKWESGASLPEVDKIIAMSRLFGVSTDYLLKDDADEEAPEARPLEPETDAHGLRILSEAELNRYLENRRACAPKIALGAAMCVACAAPLIALQSLVGGLFGLISANLVDALGVTLLMLLVAGAVWLFVTAGMRMSQYKYVGNTSFALSAPSRRSILEQKRAFTPEYKQSVAHGVMLFVLSAVPITATAILGIESLYMVGVAALLAIVATGVYLIVRDGMIMGSFDRVLRRAERSLRRAMRGGL